MNPEFKIIVSSNDSEFSINLVNECHKYGFILSFINNHENIKDEISEDIIAVVVLDMDNDNTDILKLCQDIRELYGVPIFGVLNKLNAKIQKKAKINGFDLIFTKKMLLNSIREVVIHVSK